MKEGRRFKKEERERNNKKKITIFIFFIIILGVIVLLIANPEIIKKEGKEKDNKYVISTSTNLDINLSDEIVKEKEYKDIKITDIQLNLDEQGISYFKCKIKNESNQILKKEDVYFVFLDKNNSELSKFRYRLPELQSEEEKNITIVTTTDITDSNDFYIEEYK